MKSEHVCAIRRGGAGNMLQLCDICESFVNSLSMSGKCKECKVMLRKHRNTTPTFPLPLIVTFVILLFAQAGA